MRGTDLRRLVLGILVPALLALHALCLCAGLDAHAPRATVAAAAACPEHADGASSERSSSPHDAPSCPHCRGEASLVVAGPTAAAPAAGVALPHFALVLPSLSAAPIAALRIRPPSAGPPASPLSALARSTVLRI